MSEDTHRNAANVYRPTKTHVLFVAEAPPNSADRYFFYEKIDSHDWLWIALMKALYEGEWQQTRSERTRKREWLRRFQGDGFFLIDAVKKPLSGTSRQRILRIEQGSSDLIDEIKQINPEQIILIKATVHRALSNRLRDEGLNVINLNPLPFPASWHARRFADEFRRLVPSINSPESETWARSFLPSKLMANRYRRPSIENGAD